MTEPDVFDQYEETVHSIAESVAEELREMNTYKSFDGSEWCEGEGVPQYAFVHAVETFLQGVDWGVSPMFPFRNEDEVVVTERYQEEVEEADEEEVEEVDQEDGEE